MILFDFINDEAPLFSEGINDLISTNEINLEDIHIITMGSRWHKFYGKYICHSMSEYFHQLDGQKIDIISEMQRLSQEYDTTNLFAVDRLLIEKPKEYQNKLIVYTFLFYEYLFSTFDFTHYFTTGIAYMYNMVSYEVAMRYKVKHISFYDIRNPNEKRTAISFNVFNDFHQVNEEYKKYTASLVTDNMLNRIKNFKNKPSVPTYMKNLGNKQTINLVLIKEFFIRFRKYYFEKKSSYDYFTRNPFLLSYIKIKKIFFAKLILLLKFKLVNKENMKYDKYFLYPIHMQPEASTLVLAPYYVDQLSTIVNISKTLPIGTYLYVKEHKSALGERFFTFYNELKKYPNIKLIAHDENTYKLIEHSQGIITLSSTVGWEALFFQIPVIVLGDVFYNATGLTHKISSYKELTHIIDKILNNKIDIDPEYDLKLAYFQDVLIHYSYPFEFNVYKLDIVDRLLSKSNVQNFSNSIKKILGLKKK